MTAVDQTARDLARSLQAVLIGNNLARLDQNGVLQSKSDQPSVWAAIRLLERLEAIR